MANYSSKMPFASVSGKPQFTIDDEDWQRIEATYGSSLPSDVRQAVTEATLEYLESERPERTAPAAQEAKKIIEACRRDALQFQRTLRGRGLKVPAAGLFASHLIKKNFHFLRIRGGSERDEAHFIEQTELFETLDGILMSFDFACVEAIRELEDPDDELSSFVIGNAWNRWVRRLTEIVRDAGLDWKVRQDVGNKSRNDTHSSFVILLQGIQENLPSESQRHAPALSALASAIGKARRQ